MLTRAFIALGRLLHNVAIGYSRSITYLEALGMF